MRSWFARSSLVLFVAVMLLALGGAAGAAEPPSAAQAETVSPARSHVVTLITGDRVVLTVFTDGRQTVTVAAPEGGDSAGAHGPVRVLERDGDVYAIPPEAAPYLGTLLDRELFNVTELVAQGLSDEASSSIPVIVSFKEEAKERPVPPAVTRTRTLESIEAIAGRESKAHAERFGAALEALRRHDGPGRRSTPDDAVTTAAAPFERVERIYLDERIEVALADSVPQIGAPEAWAAGFDGTGVDVAVLDTGIDGSHPDLVGKVVSEANFTPEPSPADGHGHGTHVASTIAGSGAASGGLRKGVAPGAELLNGKVLNNFGSGLESWIIDGMEWAAGSGADIISMSLGGGPTDGTDPMAQAVDEITESQGVLFAIAAGNLGFLGEQSVSTPGSASRAVTVGAVDKSDVLAGFSGRGPRVGDFAVKPDITGPGVGIIAARGAGTSLGQPVGEFYTTLSGTSMATPHVAGAAAILKQEFPDWGPNELKAALVSTAAPGDYAVYQQGGGRVDVARAFSQHVYASPAPVDFGFFPFPQEDVEPVTEQVAYSNVSDVDVTLELAVEVTDEEGNPAAEGIVTTSASSVTVPAGGTSTVDVTVDVSAGAPSLYGGFITGRSADGEVVVRTPVGFYKEPEMYNLTVNAIARDGRPAFGISLVDVVDAVDTTRYLESSFHFEGAPTFRLPPGTYSVMGFIFTYDEPQVFAEEVTMVGDPEVQITGDTTLTLDGTGAGEVVADTPRDTEPRSTSVSYFRAAAERGSFSSAFLVSPPIDRVFAAPTEPVTLGDFEFYTKWRLAAPDLEIGVAKPGSLELDANYMSGSPRLDGRDRAELVFAGLGRPEDFEGIDAQGKIALISRGELTFAQKAANAAAAGAVMAIIHNNRPGLLLGFVGQSEIPTLSISQAQGLELRELLEAGRVTLEMRGIAISPYIYDLIFPEPDRILESHRHTIDNSNTVRTNARYNAHVDPWLAGEAHHAFRPWSFFSFEFVHNVDVPQSRTEFVNVGDTRWQHMAWGSMTSEHIFEAFLQEPLVTYADRGTISDDWFEQPLHPGVVEAFEVGADNGFPLRREGDALVFFIPEYVDSQGRWGFKNFSGTDTTSFRLFRNGELVAEADRGFGEFAVPPEPSRYRAELDVSRTAPYWRMSSQVETAWTFDSAQPPPGVEEILPVLLVGYDLGELDGLNRAPRGEHAIDLFVGRQNGASPSEVTEVSVWASFDDGATWSSLPVEPRGGGSFTATVQNPQDESVEYVSLRVQASDSGGSEISQTIVRAYGLE